MLLAEIAFPALNPVAFSIGAVHVRWYGLAYLIGFTIAGAVLARLARDNFLPLSRQQRADLMGILVLGVMIGGRLGYALFYEPSLFARPLELLRIWRGGLSFHGGLLGVIIGTLLFARTQGIAWRRLADAMVLAAPFGIFIVRCANFVNAELYGRLASASVPWAMRFPTDPMARAISPELRAGGSLDWYPAFERLRDSGQWQRIAESVPLRHPSQLYEALLEGALIALILWGVYLKRRRSAEASKGRSETPGWYGALFLVLYASGRFAAEFFRQPDAQLGFVLGPFSMGQLLSMAVGIAGVAWMIFVSRRREKLL